MPSLEFPCPHFKQTAPPPWPPRPTGVEVLDGVIGDVPHALVTFVDVTGDLRQVALSPEVALNLMASLAVFVRQVGFTR